jgi:hypothetical protein
MRAAGLVLGCVLVLGATASAGERPATPSPIQAFKTVHLFNVASGAAEAQLLSDLSEMNQAITKAGHPESRYRVWKVDGEQQGTRAYLWESTWADRATYDKVHRHPEYEASIKRVGTTLEAALADHVYNRYTEVSVTPPRR